MDLSRTTLRGLNNFINKLQYLNNQEEEKIFVENELAHIRNEFKTGKKLKKHGRRKYILKLLYIYIIGYEIDFGINVINELICSNKFSDKQVGYLSLTILLYEEHEAIKMEFTQFRSDLLEINPLVQCCALNVISCIGNKDMVEFFGKDLIDILFNDCANPYVRRKTALSINQLYKKNDTIIQLETNFFDKLNKLLLSNDLSLVSCVCSIIISLSDKFLTKCGIFTKNLIELFYKLVNKNYSVEFYYYFIQSPWLLIKLIRLLRIVPRMKPEEYKIIDSIKLLISTIGIEENENTKNILYSIIFEIIDFSTVISVKEDIKIKLINIVTNNFFNSNPNLRYLIQNALCSPCFNGQHKYLQKYLDHIISSLREYDMSIKRCSLDLLLKICDSECCNKILSELLRFLPVSTLSIREETISKICFIAEKFAKSPQWYVDIMLQLTVVSGDYISDQILYRIIRTIVNNENVQSYAAKVTYKYLQEATWRESFIKISSYILGEYGFLFVKDNKIAQNIFNILIDKYTLSTIDTKYFIISAFAKLHATFPCLRQEISLFFKKNQESFDPEIADRCNHFLYMTSLNEVELLIFEPIPPWNTIEGENQGINYGKLTVTENNEDVIKKNKNETSKDDLLLLLGYCEKKTINMDKNSINELLNPIGGTSNNSSNNSSSNDNTVVGNVTIINVAKNSVDIKNSVDSKNIVDPKNIDNNSVKDIIIDDNKKNNNEHDNNAIEHHNNTIEHHNNTIEHHNDTIEHKNNFNENQNQNITNNNDNPNNFTQITNSFNFESTESIINNKNIKPSENSDKYEGCITNNIPNKIKLTLISIHKKLILTFEGVLYQDETIQIGMKSVIQSPSVKLILFFGNRINEEITIKYTIECPKGLSIKTNEFEGIIIEKAQTQSICQFSISSFYYQSPIINISYNSKSINNFFAFSLPLPLNAFLLQKPLDTTLFMQNWNSIGSSTEKKSILNLKSNDIDIPIILSGLRFICLDVKPNQIVASSCFPAFQDIFILLRIEINQTQNKACVYVRAHEIILANIIHNLICYEISE